MASPKDSLQDITSLCKRRGFIFQSSEIYGGLASCWDYGPLGVSLKRNIKDLWWNSMVSEGTVEGLDASILMASRVWEASGHVENFTDPLVDCRKCKSRFRADKAEKNDAGKIICPQCDSLDITEARNFNLMFKTFMGPVEDSAATVFMRPETAQGIYVNFHNVATSMRRNIPFGICQIGKAFRNEITPGNFIFRTREFEQMEMQFFIHPSEDDKWMKYWQEKRWKWHLDMGIHESKLRMHPHGPGELAHYAKSAFDIEYEFPFGWNEIEGVHNRTDFDLKRHQEFSRKNLTYVDTKRNNERYIPYIIETSVGADRSLLAVLCHSYFDDKDNERVVLKFSPKVAPVKAAILPLQKDEAIAAPAEKLYNELKARWPVQYDESGSIGKRYRRQDEIGTPFCITFDFDTSKDNAVTIRERDSMKQERVALDKVHEYLTKGLS